MDSIACIGLGIGVTTEAESHDRDCENARKGHKSTELSLSACPGRIQAIWIVRVANLQGFLKVPNKCPISLGQAIMERRSSVFVVLALNFAGWLMFYGCSVNLWNLNLDQHAESGAWRPSNSSPVSNQEAVQSLHKRLASHGVSPVSCSRVLRNVRTNSSTLDPNEGKLFARYTIDDPHFYISVHNQDYDHVRYSMFEKYGTYYEQALSECYRQVLSSPTKNQNAKKRVLDVGGNIGWHSLLSASLGAEVASFEPHMPNYLRTCESMCLNDWLHSTSSAEHEACIMGSDDDSSFFSDRIHIFPYAVCDSDKELNFELVNNNPGQGQIQKNVTKQSTPIRCVSLDGMVEALGWTTGEIDILKVDVEGAEMGVFLGARKLLKSQRVQNIFMEGNVRRPSEIAEFESMVKLFMDSGYHAYMIGGFSGPKSTTDVPKMGKDFTKNLITECGKDTRVRQCNLWWKTKSSFQAVVV